MSLTAHRATSFVARSLLGLLLVLGAIALLWDLWGSPTVFSDSQGQPAASVAALAPTAHAGDDQLKALEGRLTATQEKLDLAEKRVDALRTRAADIQLLVTILLGLGTLYAAAQAVFAYFNVQAMVKAARDEATAQKNEWHAFQDDCRKQFPRFAGMDEVRASILGVLASVLRTKDSAENLFDRLDIEDRQRVFFYEKSIAGLEFLNLNQTADDSVRVFRGLGRFYIDKYKSENKTLKEDLNRGEFYLELALERKNDDYRVLNDRGKVQADIYADYQAAEKLWRRSIVRDPAQQRAYYDLGTMCFQTGDYPEAIKHLRQGAEQSRWEEERNEANEGNLYFNLACALWKNAIKEGTAQPQNEPLEALKKAVAVYPKLKSDIPIDDDLKEMVKLIGGTDELNKRLKA